MSSARSGTRLGIQYDHFIRTTDPRHYETVRWLFQRCLDNGYVYKGSYTGQYCVFDEFYVNDAKPGDPCPDCGRPTETVTEENYFFKLSAFTDKLLKHYEDNPDFIQPESRRNEVVSFVRGGLQDLSISRTTMKWGIPLDGAACRVCMVRRAHRLHQRRRGHGTSGPPTCTSSAKKSSASTPSSGPPS